MTDFQALRITIMMTELRMGAQYRAAEALHRRSSASELARLDTKTNEHAAARFLIGTWDRIAKFVQDFNEAQLHRFFRCSPVLPVWLALAPGVKVIRRSRSVDQKYAGEFEKLAKKYRTWTKGPDGKDFRTEAQQVVCALFM